MQYNEVVGRLAATRAMGVLRIDRLERGLEIAEGCLSGGIDCLEISYNSPEAGAKIAALKEYFGAKLVVGAGTVLEATTARLAIISGAQFVIASTFSKEVAKLCNLYQIPYAPGCTSMTEAVEALSYGAAFIKAFPISDFYGPKFVKIFKTPFPNMPILVSGGVNLDNLREYLNYGADCIGIGGLLTKGSKEEIAANAAAITEIIASYRK